MPPGRFRGIALAGCALLGACNETRDLAPASPDTPWQFERSKEAPTAPAPAAGAKRFTVPENTAVQLPAPADIDPNHVYSLVADRYRSAPQPGDARRLGTGTADGDQCRHRARCLSSGADGECRRRLRALCIVVPQKPRPARVHRLQCSGSHPATHGKLSAVRIRRPFCRGRSEGHLDLRGEISPENPPTPISHRLTRASRSGRILQ